MKTPPDFDKVYDVDLSAINLEPETPVAENSLSRADRFSEALSEINPEALLADGLEGAVIGYASRCGMGDVAVYDYNKCVRIFMEKHDWSEEDAMEWMDFNVLGAYMGEGTPLFLTSIEAMGL